MALLEIEELVVRFGGVTALDEPSFERRAGLDLRPDRPQRRGQDDAVQLRQPALRARVAGGSRFDGEDLLARAPHQISALGIARTFQNLGLFASMTRARERDARRAQPRRARPSSARAAAARRHERDERRLRAEADEVLERLRLADVADHPAAGLPYGTLKRVELARAAVPAPAPADARRAGQRAQPRRGRASSLT